jgi:hypothetical protein
MDSMTRAPISISATAELAEEFDRVKKPFLASAINTLEVPKGVEEAFPVYGLATKYLRRLTLPLKYRRAAWAWLRPQRPPLTLDGIPLLRRDLKLDHIPMADFVASVSEACRQTERDFAALGMWCEHRIALLGLSHPKNDAISNTQEERLLADRLHGDLQKSLCNLHAVPNEGAKQMRITTETALTAAARATARLLVAERIPPGKHISVSANLMVPLDRGTYDDRNEKLPHKNHEATKQLFHGVPAEKELVIVAETREANYRGFSVPVAASIPGAPMAMLTLSPTAVFKSDIPKCKKYGDNFEKNWSDYISGSLQESFFVSFPVMLPRSDDLTNSLACKGVINVNIAPPEDLTFHRATCAEWLAVAAERVHPFAQIAYYATIHQARAERHWYFQQLDNWQDTALQLPSPKRDQHDPGLKED